ncbi:MAG TPA: hypothetical protein VGJ85_05425 [Candidatus Nanopelagicaceae bacterium]|jgi:hypothetical protein
MNLDLTREALKLLQELSHSATGELSRTVHDRVVKYEVNGHTLNNPDSSRSTTDWEDARDQLLANEFIEELSEGIYTLTAAGGDYANTHLK